LLLTRRGTNERSHEGDEIMKSRVAAVALLILGFASASFAQTPGRPVPEPDLLPLIASGVGGVLFYVRARRAKK
jgi:hypothetical protein